MAWKLYVADQARNEIMEIWQYGYDTFGLQVADDDDELIKQALRDLRGF